MAGYKTYRFSDQDPVVKILADAIKVSGLSLAAISEGTGVSLSALYSWFSTRTKRPQHASVQAVAIFLHQEFVLVRREEAARIKSRPKPRLRIVA